ncbi:GH92 family glycosyl hydrolase [Carboxylicivirga taeanensis]|uniref:GH92 family glycosyl hydrolase n=1 Tax=Carboxylicivirga taeanensis TaxID=1416875 RepID=UPI003F6DAE6F
MKIFVILSFLSLLVFGSNAQTVIWQIGEGNSAGADFALYPDGYNDYIANDFGWEDTYYLVGTSDAKTDWPYIMPGISDTWGGTWGTSGWRSSTLTVLFGVDKLPGKGQWTLVVNLIDYNAEDLPLFKVTINGKEWKYQLPAKAISSIDELPIAGDGYTIEIPVARQLLRTGGNEINMTTLEGSWVKYGQIRLEGSKGVKLRADKGIHLRQVNPAAYEVELEGNTYQPLLVDVEHLNDLPMFEVLVDNTLIFQEVVEKGRYVFEAPMPAVSKKQVSTYSIRADGQEIESGKVVRRPQSLITPAEYVDTKMGTGHSRWMIAPGPWMPFSMVKLSPDNQNAAWQGGYEPNFESIGCFSHIHEWTLAGLGMMPTNGPLQIKVGDERDPDSGYRSRIDKTTEEAPIGYYGVQLTDYNIKAELTSTTRCGFQRYTFPDNDYSRVLIDLHIPAEYWYQNLAVEWKQVSDYRIEGFSHQLTENTWAGGIDQEYTIFFVIEFDQPIAKMGGWINDEVLDVNSMSYERPDEAGCFVEFDTQDNKQVQARTGISYVSIANAAENLQTEITKPFGWDFEAVRNNHVQEWNKLLNRVTISTSNSMEKMRFYNSMYRSLCSRNTYSDVNGQWRDADENICQLDDPSSPALGCDAFWNTFWNLNQFWNLVTPEWSNRWVKSQLAMYDAGGWLAKGPAGMEYIPVMVAEHEIPMIVGAYQMGIRDYDVEKAYEAVKKMQTTPGQEVGGGYAGNRDLVTYLEHGYVPYDEGRFSNSLEYAYDDWTVSQLAKALGKEADYQYFFERGNNWRNVIDQELGYARMRDAKGNWKDDFDPYKSGANHHYVEGNAWQLTYFVPQDVPALAEMIGQDRFIERLNWGFEESDKTRYNGINDQYWDYPVVQGNQQSMHFAFLFNWVGQPWLTQKWSRAIMDRYYGYGVSNAYLGDEDQGQMSAWFVMAAMGLFQTDGGCSIDPVYEIASPLYEKVVIDLGGRYGRGNTFTIEAKNASRLNKYVQSAKLNGEVLNDFKFPAAELLKGGKLELEMDSEPRFNRSL